MRDVLWSNARLATMAGGGLGIITDGAIAARGGKIVYAADIFASPDAPPPPATASWTRQILIFDKSRPGTRRHFAVASKPRFSMVKP